MNLHLRPFKQSDLQELIELALLAFEPVFSSFEQILGSRIYPILYPDWRKRQQDGVEMISANERISLWVAEADEKVVGFIAFEFFDDKTAEVQLLAVHPAYQNHGVGTQLNLLALEQMKARGAILAVVGTGGDASHAPARRSYEKAGYTALPLVRFYKDL